MVECQMLGRVYVGVETINQLQGQWDKFELMMESHQLMVKEQVGQGWVSDGGSWLSVRWWVGCMLEV